MISERTLKQWRRDALVFKPLNSEDTSFAAVVKENTALRNQIVRLTQELMDIQLIQKGR